MFGLNILPGYVNQNSLVKFAVKTDVSAIFQPNKMTKKI